MKRILLYSHDTYGLGNIRRMLAVAENLVENNVDVSALIVSGSPMLHAFRMSDRIDYVKLPCLTRDDNGQYASKFLDLPYERLLGLRADLILNTVTNFEPDVILVDKKPLGVQNELAPAIDLLHRKANRPKLALLLREILDDPVTTKAVWERNGYHRVIRDLYDSVLVVGSPEIFDTAAEYDFPDTTREKLEYCGYIEKPKVFRPAAEVREELGVGSEPLVLVTAGGGKDGYTLFNVAMNSFLATEAPADHHLLLCLGPELGEEQRWLLKSKAAETAGSTTLDYTDDMMSYMNAADVVVSMSGYNTVTELLALNKHAVLVPRTAPVLEQWMRATRLEKLDLFSVIHPDQLTERVFADVLRRSLGDSAQPERSAAIVNLNGLANINRHIAELLGDRMRTGWSQMLLKQARVETGEFAQIGPVRLRSVDAADQ